MHFEILHILNFTTLTEIHHGGNVAEDKKIEKLGKSKGSKRKIGSPSYWKETYFSVRIIKGHHHPLCAVDFNEEIVLSGGFVCFAVFFKYVFVH